MISVASANIALSFVNTVSTDLVFTATGDPEGFDGCSLILPGFIMQGTSDSTLGGVLVAGREVTFAESFHQIVVRKY